MNETTTEPVERVRLPDEEGGIVQKLRRGIASGHRNSADGARAAGMARAAYALGRKILILRDRQVLSKVEEKTVDTALQMLEAGHYTTASRMSKPVLERHWMGGSANGIMRDGKMRRAFLKSRMRFDKTIFAIREICTDKEELEIPPQLTRNECEEAADVVNKSIQSLIILLNRIREEKSR